ncbi:PREDICTED: DEP domain-containing mTOR-interacting protein-like [Poecilia mexicana]|uniref:DEP domain-containing mTOR-interacting protein-like n=1 Tax=Poecilia formosa TaxID=48698 RepID=UPI000443E096|nr:PREDICTED: DEP domain-containing mTOR-interacting protein-like [Poecilia formosa]XP_014846070.1 PREDICTED: DEP domain-containing mTOR-interacting protein-like [Poecilia mexicana]
MGLRTADSASKNEKATKSGSCVGPARPRLRSSSDGNIYTRRTVGGCSSFSSLTLSNPKSVLRRPVSTEELQTPGSPYIKKTFTIVGDAVGWGFVVRGKQPCYIQAVEPFGPAAVAGMKVRQFVVSVNGLNVLDLDYRTVSHLILTGPRTVVMEVMEERDHWEEEEMQLTQESN